MRPLEHYLHFASRYPWKPSFPEDTLTLFFTKLISSENQILCLKDSKDPEILGIVIDKIKNLKNLACLEVLGVKNLNLYEDLLLKAKELVPKDKDGLQVTIPEGFPYSLKWFQERGFKPLYESYEMKSSLNHLSDHNPLKQIFPDKASLLYQTTLLCFQDNLDFSAAPYDEWLAHFLNTKVQQTWGYFQEDQLLGYVKISTQGEILNLGVIPQERGKGLGKKLLKWAHYHLRSLGRSSSKLTVALQNHRALSLYQSLGYEIEEHFHVLAWEK